MTRDAALAFIERLNEDPDLRAQVAAAVETAPDRTDAIVATAVAHGFQVDRAGFEAARDALAAGAEAASGELEERDLESVAGGFNPQPEPPAREWGVSSVLRPATRTILFGP